MDEDSDKTHLVGNNSFLSRAKMKAINEVKEENKMIIKGALRGRKSHGSIKNEYYITLDVRGVGVSYKKMSLKICFTKFKPDVILRQETMSKENNVEANVSPFLKKWSLRTLYIQWKS